MSYRVIRAYGEATSLVDVLGPIVEDCTKSGGRWDYGIGGCVCPSGSTYDPTSRACLDDIKPSVVGSGGSGGGVIGAPVKELFENEAGAEEDSSRILYTAAVLVGAGVLLYLFLPTADVGGRLDKEPGRDQLYFPEEPPEEFVWGK